MTPLFGIGVGPATAESASPSSMPVLLRGTDYFITIKSGEVLKCSIVTLIASYQTGYWHNEKRKWYSRT